MPHNSSSNEINKSISQEVDLRMTFNQNEKKTPVMIMKNSYCKLMQVNDL